MKRKLNWMDRRHIRRGHDPLAVRAGLSRPARGYRPRVIRGELKAMTKGRREGSGSVPSEHPLHRINA